MSLVSTKILPKLSEVVVGLFTDLKKANDAICDLSRAGFDALQIDVAYAPSQTHGDVSSAEHTFVWKLRDSFTRDLYTQGADQVSRHTDSSNVRPPTPYTEVDLRQALSEIGVSPERISLLEDEISHGVLLLVKAGSQPEKAHEIMERNEGTIRTDTALETASEL